MAKALSNWVRPLCFPAHGGTIFFTRWAGQRHRGSRATFGREQHRVAVPPATVYHVIGKAVGLAAFPTGTARVYVCKADFDSPRVDPKGDSIGSPAAIQAQKSGMVRGERVHPGALRRRRPRNDRTVPRKSPRTGLCRAVMGLLDATGASPANTAPRRKRPMATLHGTAAVTNAVRAGTQPAAPSR
jgi:hypothetical protein